MESWSSEHNAFVVEIERTPPDTLHRILKDVTMRTERCVRNGGGHVMDMILKR
jgi:cobalamin biosynthesis Mg chelatase CobN